MKKRTKIELIIFAIVAVFYFVSLFAESRGGHEVSGAGTAAAESFTESGTAGATADVPAAGVSADLQDISGDVSAAFVSADGAIPYTGSDAYTSETVSAGTAEGISEDGSYTDRDSVAMYIAAYGHLPGNFITKAEAKAAGWISEEGNLAEVCPGKCIGGDRFGNYEGSLPDKKGRKYFECDINYDPNNGYRGGERIIYSNDGLIYYTADHYKTFEKLYGDE